MTKSLPSLAQDSPLPAASTPASAPTHQGTILVIEDSPDMLHIIQLAIELTTAYTVITATDGAEALELLSKLTQAYYVAPDEQAGPGVTSIQRLPRLIISDVRMPQMGGVELMQAIQANPLYQHIPVILFSSTLLDWEIPVQPAYFLVKPFKMARLVAVIKELLAAR